MDNGRESVIRISLAALLLYSVGHFCLCAEELDRTEKELEKAGETYAALSAENAELKEKLELGYSERELEALVRRRLAFVKDGEIIFYFDKDRED